MVKITPQTKSLGKRVETKRIEDHEWLKHIAVFDSKIYRLDTMSDITHRKRIMIEGYEYNIRKVAFYIIHGRWPSRNFILPWE